MKPKAFDYLRAESLEEAVDGGVTVGRVMVEQHQFAHAGLVGDLAQLDELLCRAPRVWVVGHPRGQADGALVQPFLEQPFGVVERLSFQRCVAEANGLDPQGAVGDRVGCVDRHLLVIVSAKGSHAAHVQVLGRQAQDA